MRQKPTETSQGLKVNVANIAASINDVNLEFRSRNDDVSQIFKTRDDDDTTKLLIRTNFTNKYNRITPSNEYNKTNVSYNIISKFLIKIMDFEDLFNIMF